MVDLHLPQFSPSNSINFSANRRFFSPISTAVHRVRPVQLVPDRHCRSFPSGTAVLPALPVRRQWHCRQPSSPPKFASTRVDHLRPAACLHSQLEQHTKRPRTSRRMPSTPGPSARTRPTSSLCIPPSKPPRPPLQSRLQHRARPHRSRPPPLLQAIAGHQVNRLPQNRPSAQTAAQLCLSSISSSLLPAKLLVTRARHNLTRTAAPHVQASIHQLSSAQIPNSTGSAARSTPAVPVTTPRQCHSMHTGSAAPCTVSSRFDSSFCPKF
jgi:hypothetical protein